MGDFQKLRVWQHAKNFAVDIYKLTATPLLSKDFGLKDQIQRSSVSVASNIAEGEGYGSDKQSVRFFKIAKGSIAELTTQLIIANEIGYIDNVSIKKLLDVCDKISAMLTNLIKARN